MAVEALEKLMKTVSNGNLRDAATVSAVFEGIYRYPYFFGYSDLDEDARSSFLLSFYPHLPKLLAAYNPSRSSFSTYVANSVKLYAKSWRRIAAKERANQDSLVYCYSCENGFEDGLMVAEQEPEYGTPDDRTDAFSLSVLSEQYADMLLVLALKCAPNLSDKQIDSISTAVGLAPKVLSMYITAIKQKMSKKIEDREQLIENRNRTWFLKARYRLELERLPPESVQYAHVRKQFIYQTKALKIKNKMLKEAVIPANSHIGSLLHMDPRKVTRLLEQAKGGALMQILSKKTRPQNFA
jgi:hypothetical protein